MTFVDEFVSQSRGNGSVESLTLYAYTFDEKFDEEFNRDESEWERLGEAIGNLQVKTIYICDNVYDSGGVPNWVRLASILKHVRQTVRIRSTAPTSGWKTRWGPSLT